MSVDEKGVQPGLQSQTPRPKTVNMKCRIEGCSGVEATEITPSAGDPANASAAHNRTYQCTKCRATYTLPVGGYVGF